MLRLCSQLVAGWVLLSLPHVVSADEERKASSQPKPSVEHAARATKSVEQITTLARKSVVVIKHAGRDGKRQGLGTGFVVGADGLIATNLHVIGEARAISVETADGKRHAVTSIHASDRSLDLALIRIDARYLPVMELGASQRLKAG